MVRALPATLAALAALAGSTAGCALPVVSAGTFLPAGDLEKGQLHASVSLEAGRVLAGPSDVGDVPPAVPGSRQWEVSTWVASDVSLRWQALRRLALEVQLKLSNPIAPFTPAFVGGSLGGRFRLTERHTGEWLSVEVGVRAVFVGVEEQLTRTHDGTTQVDTWNYRSLGVEVPLIASWRINPLFAVTASPFLRTYWIRAWHTTQAAEQTAHTLEWTPVLSGGLGMSAALDLGPLEIAPGVALELVTRPGPNAPTHFLFEPGLSIGHRW
jgi:hypothetical protein